MEHTELDRKQEKKIKSDGVKVIPLILKLSTNDL